ncbi:MAG: glutamine-hydrolyzing carbamoyl-phosphate synthase small subunit [Gammaproteobacteria bacterium]|nr:glutamine-hydrolyzing carbamoyl-phosphate synthase small subunit [Gammaproteobacteria bacterium]MDE2023467.1 glutamine-hydrolyzing carbamoyl-phosphate synthase small subunit [Gammaproteobacteria bacterium]
MEQPAILALEDGTIFRGVSIGVSRAAVGEVVFNTAMTGYQEILTDPSYYQQLVTLTYPHIGNTGINPEDAESARVMAAGLIIRDLPMQASSWRMRETLGDYLRREKIVAIAGIDTRKLTRLLREQGAQNGCIAAGADVEDAAALQQARAFPGLNGMDLAKAVSTRKPYEWNQGTWRPDSNSAPTVKGGKFHVVAYDYGTKLTILRILVDHGCRVTVVPAQTTARDALAFNPDGLFFSNGPGDPAPCDYAIQAMREFLKIGVPIFGICLGHQLLGLASGARTVKMKFGHHGANHPVLDLGSGRVMISSQNHGFAVDEGSLPPTLRATHRSLFDGTLQGMERTDCEAFSFQGHPEASPGPHDVRPLFERFVNAMAARRASGQMAATA